MTEKLFENKFPKKLKGQYDSWSSLIFDEKIRKEIY